MLLQTPRFEFVLMGTLDWSFPQLLRAVPTPSRRLYDDPITTLHLHTILTSEVDYTSVGFNHRVPAFASCLTSSHAEGSIYSSFHKK
jgi:hypothetical protein